MKHALCLILLVVASLPALGQITLAAPTTTGPCAENAGCIAFQISANTRTPTSGYNYLAALSTGFVQSINGAAEVPLAVAASTAITPGSLAVTPTSTTLASTTGVLALTGTSGGAADIASLSVSSYCVPSATASCSITLLNTSTTAIALAAGVAANQFANAYSLIPSHGILMCTSYGATLLWYCK
jgi:hypothetical protein